MMVPVRLMVAAFFAAALPLGVAWTYRPKPAQTGIHVAVRAPDDRVQQFGPVSFLPVFGGYHTAWLVTGSLASPVRSLREIPEPEESRGTLPAQWRLVTSNSSTVNLPEAGPGVVYATGDLNGTGGRRRVAVIATGGTRLWVNDQVVAVSTPYSDRGLHVIDARVDLPVGHCRVAVELTVAATGAEFQFVLRPDSATATPAYSAEASDQLVLSLCDTSHARLVGILLDTLSLSPPETETWVVPGQPWGARLIRRASSPAIAGALTGSIALATDDIPPQEDGRFTIDLGNLQIAECPVPITAPSGRYRRLQCMVELQPAPQGKTLARYSATGFSFSGMVDAIAELERAAHVLGQERGMAAAALALLKCEKARLLLEARRSFADTGQLDVVDEEISAAADALKHPHLCYAGQDRSVGWLEQAYWSEIDNSPQPYRVYVPDLPDKTAATKPALPMVVYLHGYVQSYDKHRWVEERDMKEVTAIADRLGFVLLVPFGRSNTDFASIGEADVLTAVREASRRLPVDPERVYLFGYSMGAYGAYLLATHYPDMFAGVVALAGRPEPYYQEQMRLRGVPRERLPAYKRYCLDVDNPLNLAANLRNVPVMIVHARDDSVVSVDGARRMAELLRAAGAPVKTAEGVGDHWACWDVLSSPAAYEWLLGHRRQSDRSHTRVRTFSPRFGSTNGCTIKVIDRWTQPAELAVLADRNGMITIGSDNVREFVISGIRSSTEPRVAGADKFITSTVLLAPELWEIRGRLTNAPAARRWQKTAALCGPMREACNVPFLVVYDEPGTSAIPGDAGPATDTSEAKARRFAEEWQAFAKGKPQVKCEKDLTEQEKRSRSLLLFCTPSRSNLLREASATLECTLTDKSFSIAGKTIAMGDTRGIVLTRPNPWAPDNDRYLVVFSGLAYGSGLAVNHKLDLIPDFIVFGAENEGLGEPAAFLAGFFDSDWRPDPRLIETAQADGVPAHSRSGSSYPLR